MTRRKFPHDTLSGTGEPLRCIACHDPELSRADMEKFLRERLPEIRLRVAEAHGFTDLAEET